jgi:hypothetical protein
MHGARSGRGLGVKGHDYLVAYLCYKCHDDYHNFKGNFSKEKRDATFDRAIIKTMAVWVPRLLVSEMEVGNE